MDGEGYLRTPPRKTLPHHLYADLTVRAVPTTSRSPATAPERGYLRLWKAEPIEKFDYDNLQLPATGAIIDRERTMDISRVLYPSDTTFGAGPARAPAVLLLLRLPAGDRRTTCVTTAPT